MKKRSQRTLILVLSFALFLQACASARKSEHSNRNRENRSVPSQSRQDSPLEIYGPPAPEEPQNYGPEPIQLRPVVLVLGPGLARGFAHVGVVRALMESKVPIGAIYGTEIGSLIGALAAVSSNLNQFEWGLQKFRPDIFLEQRSFLARIKNDASEGEKFEKQLKNVFGNKDLGDTKILLRIGIQNKDTGSLMILDRGGIAQAIRVAMATPELFTPSYWPRKEAGITGISSAASRPFLIQEAKNLGIGPVVVVDVLNDSEEAVAYDELKQADLMIKPDVKGIGPMDFQKKTESAYRGKTAVIKNIAEIRRLVGMPENDSEKKER